MNGRRVRENPNRVIKMNREIQEINESVARCAQLLDSLERTVRPGDWLNGHIDSHFRYQTWRTVGFLNLTDHFIARYLERIGGKYFNEDTMQKLYGQFTLNERDHYRVKYAYEQDWLDEGTKQEIREFVKNPPDECRVVRQGDRVITVLFNEE